MTSASTAAGPRSIDDLTGRRVLVTGGGRGLGRAIADDLAGHGALVTVLVRTAEAAADLRSDVRLSVVQADVTDPAALQSAVRRTVELIGGLDVVIANAGISRPGPLAVADPHAVSDVLHNNIFGTYVTLTTSVPALAATSSPDSPGKFIALSSALARSIAPGAGAYSMSKAAIETMVKIAAVELAQRSITVNALSPGFIDAGMGSDLIANQTVWDRYATRIAAGRPGTAADISAAARWLSSRASDYVNGHVLEVNGGLDF